MSQNMKLAMLLPVLAILVIAAYAGGLGVLFMIINSTTIHETGVIILGVALVVGVPAGAYLIQRRIEGPGESSSDRAGEA